MVTRRCDCSSSVTQLVCVALVLAAAPSLCVGQTRTPRDILLATYGPGAPVTVADANRAIEALGKALLECRDDRLTWSIKHRIAVMCFRAGMLDEARARFGQLESEPTCPEPVRLSSLNMVGQICRMTGSNEKALDAFRKLANLVEHGPSGASQAGPDATALRLLCSALISRAEIYEVDSQCAKSIAEYRRLLVLLRGCGCERLSQQYAPLISDRLCQLLLRGDDVDGYVSAAEALITDYPRYYRAALVELEVACVKFLKTEQPQTDFTYGSVDVPVRAIARIREAEDKSVSRQLLLAVSELCRKYGDSYGGLLVAYHYAWVLDALGNRSKAAATMNQVFSADIEKMGEGPRKQSIARTIQGYARIQHAITLAEHCNYQRALQVLSDLSPESDTAHLLKLSQSVTKSTETLRREVPRDETR